MEDTAESNLCISKKVGEGDSPATWSHPNLLEPVIKVQNNDKLKSETSRRMNIDNTVFKITVSTCLKGMSTLLIAPMLMQCCSDIRESACTCLLRHVYSYLIHQTTNALKE